MYLSTGLQNLSVACSLLLNQDIGLWSPESGAHQNIFASVFCIRDNGCGPVLSVPFSDRQELGGNEHTTGKYQIRLCRYPYTYSSFLRAISVHLHLNNR